MTSEPVLAIVGGSFSGNKGAASMTQAVADGVRDSCDGLRVRVFSPYPEADRSLGGGWDIVDFRPRTMLLAIPLALGSLLTGRRWLPRRGAAGALAEANVVADVSGIAFMSGRGMVTLGYNVVLVFLPWAFGVPIVKVAQALGPFRGPTRIAAALMLRRVRWIGLRGGETATNVARLGLDNGEPAADVAFLLSASEEDGREAERLVGGRTPTLVIPSVVVEEACRAVGIDYPSRMVNLVRGLREAGHDVVVLAHSARDGAPAGRTNDLVLCRSISTRSGAEVVDRELSAGVLRAVIARGRLLVTSRFHGMISGLATHTPTFVVGWSHKYLEVLSDFELEDCVVDFSDLSDEALLEAVLKLDGTAPEVRERIADHLPAVMRSAQLNISTIVRVLGDTRE